MNNAEVIKGIETVIEGLNIIKQNLSAADGGEKTAAPKSTVKREKAQKETEYTGNRLMLKIKSISLFFLFG